MQYNEINAPIKICNFTIITNTLSLFLTILSWKKIKIAEKWEGGVLINQHLNPITGPINTQLVSQWSMKNQLHWPETDGKPMKSALFALNHSYVATKSIYLDFKLCNKKNRFWHFIVAWAIAYCKYASNYI